MISVDIGAPDPGMRGEFEALCARAAPNAFMHPAALCAAAATGFAQVRVLRAYAGEGAARRLVGFWALRERRLAPFVRYLETPPYDYAFAGGAVIDPDHDAIPAMLDAIARAQDLPKVVKLKLIDGAAAAPVVAALGARRGAMLRLAEHPRPFLSGEADRKRSGSTGKSMRQHWNRLSAQGETDVVNVRTAEAARAALEIFLELELRSWKGANGTALLSHDEDAEFARVLIGGLADADAASVALLRHGGRAIAAQVLLYSGTMAYTWKTAFDAEFSKFSPGILLVDKVTDTLLGSGVTQIESCAREDSFMAQIWTGRRSTVDLLADVGHERSLPFTLAAFAERAHDFARAQRDRLRAAHWLPVPRKNAAVTRG